MFVCTFVHTWVFIRELEGLIYQCGLHMDELKEQVEQARQEQPTCEASLSPPPQPTPSSALSEGGETLSHPQVPPPLLCALSLNVRESVFDFVPVHVQNGQTI